MVANPAGPSAAQIRLYHVLARRLGWSDEQRRAFLLRNLGRRSSKDLTRAQLSSVIDWQQYALGLRTARPRWRPRGPTRGQFLKIEQFKRLPCPAGWRTHPARSVVMMGRLAKRDVAGVEELTTREASTFIEFLKAVFGRSSPRKRETQARDRSGAHGPASPGARRRGEPVQQDLPDVGPG